ncbi:MAG: DPP IV N-terminal domain-containing protein [Opitutaceae bacterium]|nr:DPP IV N-terminal domain-containing protein [Opitutaceae bacterium]
MIRLVRLLPTVVLLALAPAAPASNPPAPQPADARLAWFRDLAETRNFTLGLANAAQLTPDGRFVLFLRAGGPRTPVQRLYEHDVTRGTEEELATPEQLLGAAEERLSPEEKARRERQRQSLKGFTAFDLSRDGTRVLVTLGGRLFVIDRATRAVTPLPGEDWIDPQFSPDGRFVAAVARRELHVIDIAAGSVRAVTSGATETVSHGLAEFVAQEEMSRHHGYWWSPDSAWLAFQENDESMVETRFVADPLHPEQPPQASRYPRAGTPNAQVRLGLVARDGGPVRWIVWDREAYPYLARVTWDVTAAPLTILVQDRAQQEQILLAVDTAAGTTRELVRERDAAWIDLDESRHLPRWLERGERFLWTTERGGAWQVELREATGAFVRTLTPPDFWYRSLLEIDEAAGWVYARGSRDPREVNVWRFPLAGGAGEVLPYSRASGQHQVVFARDFSTLLHSYELADGRAGREVIARDGRVLGRLASVAEPLPRAPRTELTQIHAGDLMLYAAITRPARDLAAGEQLPVILDVYAGPTSTEVEARARAYLPDQALADEGYLVVRIDGRGTPWRGRDWLRCVRGNLIDIALADQIAGLQALGRRYPEMDLTRVGVMGWSFGGYFAAMATIRRPDVFRAGIAGAPVITWENYDTYYTERYLGLPQDQPEAYRLSNVTTYAAELRRPLLLIHGLTDDNVYAQHTLQLCDALYRAGRPYEFMPMLGTHMVSDPLTKLRQHERVVEFFQRTLR